MNILFINLLVLIGLCLFGKFRWLNTSGRNNFTHFIQFNFYLVGCQQNDRVRLSEVQVLTLRTNSLTTGRRSSRIQQVINYNFNQNKWELQY